jgi:nucleoside-diphosphate-sugar epimerase
MILKMQSKKRAIVCGAGGFIGSHIVNRLKKENFWVKGVDLKYPQFSKSTADEFTIGDLTCPNFVKSVILEDIDELYQLAADMGGAGYIFTGENDANVMHNSALINLNILNEAVKKKVKRIFYSSSACIYPEYNQLDPNNPKCSEESAYPAAPDSEYGWEKLFSERLYFAYKRNYNLDVHVARYHNVFGPEGTYKGGKEKSPAALCRKVIEAKNKEEIEIWGDGKQTRSFLYIDECVEGTLKLMRSNFEGPVNIGSEEMISINDFAKMIIELSGKALDIKNIHGPLGVRGRKSDNKLIKEKLNWEPCYPLIKGIKKTFEWIQKQIH